MNRHVGAIAALAITALSAGLGGCASRAAARGLEDELADLRREERRLREEIAALRVEIARLGEQLAAAPLTRTAPLPVEEHPAGRVTPLAPSPSAPAIATLLDAYREAFETKDIERLRRDIYGGELPAEDLRYFELWFKRAEELVVRLDPQAIDVEDGSARAVVRQSVTYRLSRTHESRSARLEVRMRFERSGAGWRLVGVDARR